MIPKANVQNLMLKKEVVAAMEKGSFSVSAVNTVDEAVELLTGIPAGERDDEGNYPEDSINGRVEATLLSFAKTLQEFDKEGEDKDSKKNKTE